MPCKKEHCLFPFRGCSLGRVMHPSKWDINQRNICHIQAQAPKGSVSFCQPPCSFLLPREQPGRPARWPRALECGHLRRAGRAASLLTRNTGERPMLVVSRRALGAVTAPTLTNPVPTWHQAQGSSRGILLRTACPMRRLSSLTAIYSSSLQTIITATLW